MINAPTKMVVSNGDKMNIADQNTDATSVSKLKEIQELEHSNFDVPQCKKDEESTHDTGISGDDMYADVEPTTKGSSNGNMGSSPMCVIESCASVEESRTQVSSDGGKRSTLSDVFGQLVSDTLTDDACEGVDQEEVIKVAKVSTGSPNNIECASTPLGNTVCKPQAVVAPQPVDETDCNGDHDDYVADEQDHCHGSAPSDGVHVEQEEVSFSVAVNSGSEQDIEDGEVDDDDDYDEPDSDESDEFAEDEYRAEMAAYKTKDSHENGSKQLNDSSIMIVDSDDGDEEECDDLDENLDEEDLQEEEEQLDEEEEQVEEEEEYDDGDRSEEDLEPVGKVDQNVNSGKGASSKIVSPSKSTPKDVLVNCSTTNGSISRPHKPGPLRSKANKVDPTQTKYLPTKSDHSSVYQEKAIKDFQSTCNNSKCVEFDENRSQRDSNYANMGRDHPSIMKKVQFTQKLNAAKRNINNSKYTHSAADNMENWNEDEGWKLLEQWNEMRQEGKNEGKILNKFSGKKLNNTTKPEVLSLDTHGEEKDLIHKLHNDGNKPEPKEAAVTKVISRPPAPESPTLVAQLNEAKGYFEIGRCPEDCPDLAMHVFSITIIFAKGLNEVVPGAVLRSCKEGPYFSYSLLGCPVNTDPIPDPSAAHFPAEKANARVLATRSNMTQYLCQHKVLSVALMIGEIKLATCSVDLTPLCQATAEDNSKVEGAYPLLPVEGNLVSVKRQTDVMLGLSVELTRSQITPQTKKNTSGENDSLLKSAADDVTEETKDRDQIRRCFSKENDELIGPSKKRERHNSSSSDESLTKDNSITLSETRKNIKQQLNPPLKKRKLTDEDQQNDIDGTDAKLQSENSRILIEADEDLQQWRKAQENLFWKQWLVREKKLQETLEQEWRSRVEGLETELLEQMEEVEQERSLLEEEWRSIKEREQRCRHREEQLLQLQEDVLHQQAELGSQLRLTAAPHDPPHRRLALTHRPVGKAGSAVDHKQYYKSQWLRGVATTHRRWTADEGTHSRFLAAGSSNTRVSPGTRGRVSLDGAGPSTRAGGLWRSPATREPSTDKYDTDIVNEISRLTKERKLLLGKQQPNPEKLADINNTIQQLMDASGI